jgi:HSP20 family molecular chaperone IbpA
MAAETTVPAPIQSDGAGREQTREEQRYVPPPVDIFEDEQGLVMLADLPGVEPGDLEVRLDRDHLTIQARANHLASGQPVYREFALTGFFREFEIMEDIDPDRISAELKNGVMTLRMPRAEHAQPRRIEVRAS